MEELIAITLLQGWASSSSFLSSSFFFLSFLLFSPSFLSFLSSLLLKVKNGNGGGERGWWEYVWVRVLTGGVRAVLCGHIMILHVIGAGTIWQTVRCFWRRLRRGSRVCV